MARKLVKEQGGSGICVYKEEMRAKRDDAIQITGRFYGAMQQGELEVYLQPKFNLEERKIYGAEALARWRTKTGEMIMPGRFVPPLENIGYVVDLDFYIYEQLLRAMKRWKKAGKELFTICLLYTSPFTVRQSCRHVDSLAFIIYHPSSKIHVISKTWCFPIKIGSFGCNLPTFCLLYTSTRRIPYSLMEIRSLCICTRLPLVLYQQL